MLCGALAKALFISKWNRTFFLGSVSRSGIVAESVANPWGQYLHRTRPPVLTVPLFRSYLVAFWLHLGARRVLLTTTVPFTLQWPGVAVPSQLCVLVSVFL